MGMVEIGKKIFILKYLITGMRRGQQFAKTMVIFLGHFLKVLCERAVINSTKRVCSVRSFGDNSVQRVIIGMDQCEFRIPSS